MADQYSQIGTAGVNLTDQEYAPSDGTLDNAQNAEMVFDTENGGEPSLQRRGGYTTLGSSFASGVTALIELRHIASL